MRKTFKINGVDFTSLTTDAGCSVVYRKIQGEAGGPMLTGRREEDVLAIHAVVTQPIRPLLGDEATALLSELQASDSPVIYYYDKKAGGYRTIQTICEEPDIRYAGDNLNGDEVWIAQPLVFEENDDAGDW